jgi:hypothetical protein
MGDDQLGASQLRNRYKKGGLAPDSELSSSQLRARYAIPGNKSDFSTGEGGGMSTMIIGVVVLLLVVGGAVFAMNQQ